MCSIKLMPVHKADGIKCCIENLHLLLKGCKEFLALIMMGNKSWYYHYDPFHLQEAHKWTVHGEQPSGQTQRQCSADKLLLSVFWDQKGVLLVDYL